MDAYFKVFYYVFAFVVIFKCTTCLQNNDQHAVIEEKIIYKGDQVLRVEAVNSKQRKKIKELENQGCK